jgi:putative transposase
MNFLAAALFDGRRLRTLTLVCLAIEVNERSKARTWLPALTHDSPRTEPWRFQFEGAHKWAYENSVDMDFSRPGKPTDSAKRESLNGRFRAHWFLSLEALEDAGRKIAM